MGKGITTRSGADPLVQWALRIQNFGSAELSAALEAFLGGQPLVSTDGDLEISELAKGDNRFRVSLRIPDAPYVADIVVQAVEADGGVDVESDPRNAIPSPDGWITEGAHHVKTWELFNCVLITLQSRENRL